MDEIEAANWTRHFDTLLWSVTSIFATAIGALIAYSYSNFDIAISIAGLFFTILPVYFGASFRELRKRVNKYLNPELKAAIRYGRSLYQWPLFVSIFVVFQALWVLLLLKNESTLWWIWITLGITALSATLWLANIGKVTVQEEETLNKTN